jgi:hypothetical protein
MWEHPGTRATPASPDPTVHPTSACLLGFGWPREESNLRPQIRSSGRVQPGRDQPRPTPLSKGVVCPILALVTRPVSVGLVAPAWPHRELRLGQQPEGERHEHPREHERTRRVLPTVRHVLSSRLGRRARRGLRFGIGGGRRQESHRGEHSLARPAGRASCPRCRASPRLGGVDEPHVFSWRGSVEVGKSRLLATQRTILSRVQGSVFDF